MALSDLSKKIRRYHVLHAAAKAAEKELDALKEWFRTESGGADASFKYADKEVVVTRKTRSSWDGDKLTVTLGAKVEEFKKTSSHLEVSCRKTAREVKAGKSKRKAAEAAA